jgi:hypothetical protein
VFIVAAEVSTMGRLGLACKILFSGDAARQAAEALSGTSAPAIEQAPPQPVGPVRSEAVTLLAALQRDARFVDFIQESIEGYNDAQVGAAVRDVHRGCRDVLERMFDLQPVVDQEEDSTIEVSDPAAAKWRLTGNVGQSSGAVSGKLMHSGWKSSKYNVPEWSGTATDADVVAPAEVQIS